MGFGGGPGEPCEKMAFEGGEVAQKKNQRKRGWVERNSEITKVEKKAYFGGGSSQKILFLRGVM